MKKKILKKRWRSMHNRCYGPSDTSFKYYGGNGIIVCQEWFDFQTFYNDMAASFKKGLTLERKNYKGDYCKSNCCWATPKQQARNRSSNKLLTCFGETKTLAEWAEVIGVSPKVIAARMRKGWPAVKVLDKTIHRRGETNFNSQLNERQVIDIFTSNLMVKDLMNKYNVGRGAITAIKTGNSWSWLTHDLKKGRELKLSPDKAVAIFKASGRIIDIAKRFDRPVEAISRIRLRKTHSKLTEGLVRG